MRLSLNLATRPFVELRPFFLRLRIVMASLAVLAVGLAVTSHVLQKRVDAQEAQLNAVKAQTLAVQQERSRDERRMQLPQNAAVLSRAHFLNALFLHKSFSWTAVMMDLETVLPLGVQVTSIEPQVSANGDVGIRLRVAGDRDRAVQLLRNLEHSRRFLQPRLSTEVSQAKEGQQGTAAAAVGANGVPGALPGVEFDILATYNPLPEGQAYPKPKVVRAVATPVTANPAPVAPLSGQGRPAAPAAGRNGRYPSDGVVLRPYAAPHPGGTVPSSAPSPAGPPRRQP